MPQKRVSVLADAINAARLIVGRDEIITGVTNDSRQVQPGYLYAALSGQQVNGHRFIADAIGAGASAILCSQVPESLPTGIAVLQSDQPRLALSEISDRFFDSPSTRMEVVGVTGTDGKTSTVYFLHQLLGAAGARSGFLSTAAMELGGNETANPLHQSTPESPVIHAALNEMAEAGNAFAVLESTSHGLSPATCRLAHVTYRAAVVTNLTHEHLEFHGTYDRYRHDKANLFRALDRGTIAECDGFRADLTPGARQASSDPPDEPVRSSSAVPVAELTWSAGSDMVQGSGTRFGIVNLDSEDAAYFGGATSRPVFGYGTSADRGALWATDLRPEATGTRFTIGHDRGQTATRLLIPGVFNVENVLAAILGSALLTGGDPIDLAQYLEQIRPVRGRMNVIRAEPFSVIVDYAHTPGSFLRTLPFFREHSAGRLIAVFGSAGDRDVEKRPLQGEIAGRYADIIVLTDEDPRSEPSVSILDQIAAGCPDRRVGDDLYLIPDRREAIRHSFRIAGPGDTVLLLGKGHEASIIGADGPEPWDEERVAREELLQLGLD